MRVDPYLFFDGNCEEAFTFYADTLRGTITFMQRHRGTPAESQVPEEWQDKVMHVRLELGDRAILGSDAPPPHFHRPEGFSVSLTLADPAEAERVYNALAEGGHVGMPLQETFWAARFAMLVDRFGTPWMINCERPA